MIRRLLISLLLLALVAAAATAIHLQLHRAAWTEQSESPILWDWTAAIAEGRLPFAVAQYMAIAGAFALAWVCRHRQWRMLRGILIAWGITWVPVALISSADVTASSAGPFNFPMSMFAAPIFGLFCIAELGFMLLFRAFRTPSTKTHPLAQRLSREQNSSDT